MITAVVILRKSNTRAIKLVSTRQVLSSLVLFCAAISLAHGANVNVGKVKSSGCKRCHGEYGLSKNPKYPSLAGQQERYLVKAMKDYKNGKRDNAAMRSIILGLSDSSIKDIAAYYSSLKIRISR